MFWNVYASISALHCLFRRQLAAFPKGYVFLSNAFLVDDGICSTVKWEREGKWRSGLCSFVSGDENEHPFKRYPASALDVNRKSPMLPIKQWTASGFFVPSVKWCHTTAWTLFPDALSSKTFITSGNEQKTIWILSRQFITVWVFSKPSSKFHEVWIIVSDWFELWRSCLRPIIGTDTFDLSSRTLSSVEAPPLRTLVHRPKLGIQTVVRICVPPPSLSVLFAWQARRTWPADTKSANSWMYGLFTR
jgi:hypothetical protein